mmetsp:Transcript_13021/g.27078  ORF Transcript_13021/g.27078 Transcript_13021/m.27078 type:complete len:100 (+) Transcript_13021:1-300(+)
MAYWNHASTSGLLPSEIRKQEELKKEAELLREAQEAERRKHSEGLQRLKELKLQLAALEPLKEKGWDELTEEDEKQMETEVALRDEISGLEAALEKVGG